MTTINEIDLHDGDELWSIAEVAAVVRVPVATLRYWRHLGQGPAGFRVGRCVRYWKSEVMTWLHQQAQAGARDIHNHPRLP